MSTDKSQGTTGNSRASYIEPYVAAEIEEQVEKYVEEHVNLYLRMQQGSKSYSSDSKNMAIEQLTEEVSEALDEALEDLVDDHLETVIKERLSALGDGAMSSQELPDAIATTLSGMATKLIAKAVSETVIEFQKDRSEEEPETDS